MTQHRLLVSTYERPRDFSHTFATVLVAKLRTSMATGERLRAPGTTHVTDVVLPGRLQNITTLKRRRTGQSTTHTHTGTFQRTKLVPKRK